ncbi:MAG: hypothetical protein WBP31_08815 [Chitinophagales bacterium]|jgi:hypothetical protein|nr:hypothetical protein [Bacteroidota bacterium]
MRNLKNLNIDESIKRKKLIYTENWFGKLDQIVIYIFFSWGFVLPFLVYFNPNRDFTKTGIEYYLLFIFSIFCGYVIFRKATEKKLTEIESQFDTEKNKEIINEYCQKMGFEKYRNSKNITIYNSVNTLSLNSNYKISRIFLLDNKKVYLTMIKENYKMNIPVLFSQIILKKEIEKLIKK